MIIFLWQPFPFYEDIRNATRHSLIDFPNLHILYQIKLLSREVEDYQFTIFVWRFVKVWFRRRSDYANTVCRRQTNGEDTSSPHLGTFKFCAAIIVNIVCIDIECGAIILRAICTKNFKMNTPQLAREDEVWSVFCENKPWFIICLDHGVVLYVLGALLELQWCGG